MSGRPSHSAEGRAAKVAPTRRLALDRPPLRSHPVGLVCMGMTKRRRAKRKSDFLSQSSPRDLIQHSILTESRLSFGARLLAVAGGGSVIATSVCRADSPVCISLYRLRMATGWSSVRALTPHLRLVRLPSRGCAWQSDGVELDASSHASSACLRVPNRAPPPSGSNTNPRLWSSTLSHLPRRRPSAPRRNCRSLP